MFKLENLPKKYQEMIASIEWADDLIDDCIGLVNLKDEYEFLDGSHVFGFTSKADLISFMKSEARPAPKRLYMENGKINFYYGDSCVYSAKTIKETEDKLIEMGWKEYDVIWTGVVSCYGCEF